MTCRVGNIVKKAPGLSPGGCYKLNSIVSMNSIEKSKSENNRNYPRPRFPLGKSVLVIVGLCALTAMAIKLSGCSPVSLHLKAWQVEFEMKKGECPSLLSPQLPPQ